MSKAPFYVPVLLLPSEVQAGGGSTAPELSILLEQNNDYIRQEDDSYILAEVLEMAKISDFDAAATLDGTEPILCVRDTITQTCTPNLILEYIGGMLEIRRGTMYKSFTVGANDDEFDDGTFSGWTEVHAGSVTITKTENNDVLSLAHPGGDAGAGWHAFMKTYALAVGEWIEVAYRQIKAANTLSIMGLCVADDLTYGSMSAQIFAYYSPSENQFYYLNGFNFNNYTTFAQYTRQDDVFTHLNILRLKRVTSTTWQLYASTDGISYTEIGTPFTRAVTCNYIGFACTSWASTEPMTYTLEYFRQGS